MPLRSFVIALLAATVLSGPPARAESEIAPLPTGTDVDYQLGGAADRGDDVGILVRDRNDEPAAGRYNICYVNGFQTQPDEKKFWRQREGLLLHKRGRLVIDGNWGEWLLDVRTKAKRQRLARIVDGWVEQCAVDGYDAVEFDNLDSFTRSRHLIKRRASLVFAEMLIDHAHGVDLAAAQKNLAGYDGTTIGFDFAISESCARYRECDRYVSSFGDQVVMVEYRDKDFAKACQGFGASHAIVRRDLLLKPDYTPSYC